MKHMITITYEFVSSIPNKLKERTLYVSLDYGTVIHKCCCGCGNEVVTPLSPTDWKLIYDGVSISLYPSIGNWNFDCKSHYWIDRNNIKWTDQWSDKQIAAGRSYDLWIKNRHYGITENQLPNKEAPNNIKQIYGKSQNSILYRIKQWLLNR